MSEWWGWLLCAAFTRHEWRELRGWTGRVVCWVCRHCGELRGAPLPRE